MNRPICIDTRTHRPTALQHVVVTVQLVDGRAAEPELCAPLWRALEAVNAAEVSGDANGATCGYRSPT
jgi:hypothetical protein